MNIERLNKIDIPFSNFRLKILEVLKKEGYIIDFYLEDSKEKITIATTRPETMIGDSAVAVNPNDE